MGNRFEDALNSLMNFLMEFSECSEFPKCVLDNHELKPATLFRKAQTNIINIKKKYTIENLTEINSMYKEKFDKTYNINALIPYNLSFQMDNEHFVDIVSEFARFLRVAEKLFLYDNDQSCEVFSEIIDNKTILFVRSDERGFKSRIVVEKTMIDNLLNGEASLERLFNGDKSKLSIITIDINRDYGKKMLSSFKFPYSTELDIDDSDRTLFELYKSIVISKICQCYLSIVESTFKIMNIDNLSEENSYWENFKYGLFYYKPLE